MPNRKIQVKALKRGEHIAKQVIDNKVHCFIWRDRKPVAFVDTICNATDTSVVTRKLSDGSHADFSCPSSVRLYNQNMDLTDQMRRAYTCTRKSKSRWYMRMFWFFFDLAILNSYILESVSPNHVPPIARTGRQKKRYRSHLESLLGITLQEGSGVGLGVTFLLFSMQNSIFPHSYRLTQLVLCVVNLDAVRELSMAVACVVTFICAQYPVLVSTMPVK